MNSMTRIDAGALFATIRLLRSCRVSRPHCPQIFSADAIYGGRRRDPLPINLALTLRLALSNLNADL